MSATLAATFVLLLPTSPTAAELVRACAAAFPTSALRADCRKLGRSPELIAACGTLSETTADELRLGRSIRLDCLKAAPPIARIQVCSVVLQDGREQLDCLKLAHVDEGTRSCASLPGPWALECVKRGWRLAAGSAAGCRTLFPEAEDPKSSLRDAAARALGTCFAASPLPDLLAACRESGDGELRWRVECTRRRVPEGRIGR